MLGSGSLIALAHTLDVMATRKANGPKRSCLGVVGQRLGRCTHVGLEKFSMYESHDTSVDAPDVWSHSHKSRRGRIYQMRYLILNSDRPGS